MLQALRKPVVEELGFTLGPVFGDTPIGQNVGFQVATFFD